MNRVAGSAGVSLAPRARQREPFVGVADESRRDASAPRLMESLVLRCSVLTWACGAAKQDE
jgi:hypothetical protein